VAPETFRQESVEELAQGRSAQGGARP
jgi:hypothetical protein